MPAAALEPGRQAAEVVVLLQHGDPYMVSAVDADGRVGIDWGVYGAPETFLVDPEGTVIYKHLGPLDQEVWQREFVARMEMTEGSR